MKKISLGIVLILCVQLQIIAQKLDMPVQFSGIYPSLAYFNNEGECGTGAVVHFADRLWVITYGPHLPWGSSDKLYEITPDLKLITRPESIGGTPANRMIHKESNQLFIGPYAIDAKRNVRVIPASVAPGRHTGIARDLFDPKNKVVLGTMEEGFYEVDVHSLAVKTLYEDGNEMARTGKSTNYESDLLLGVHGKGLYSSQGVMVYSNNGEAGWRARFDPRIEAGSLSEWDGKNWKLIRRNQFVEVTGPGGIYGNENPDSDPIWATGWDAKSVLVGVRHDGKWSFYRLPKASNSYDGAHGWNTEWPRIRDIGTAQKKDYLMTMHGMFWRFPELFTPSNSAGIRPRSSYLKVIGDYTRYNNQLVFGCDDSANKEFLNTRSIKGKIEGPGNSNSNLWFTGLQQPDNIGTTDAGGAVWQKETVKAGELSEPFLFAGWIKRACHLKNDSDKNIDFAFEVDKAGNNQWTPLKTVTVPARGGLTVTFAANETGEWVRIKAGSEALVSASFVYSDTRKRTNKPDKLFAGMADVNSKESIGGIMYTLGNNRRVMGILANSSTNNKVVDTGYYELDETMKLTKKADAQMTEFIKNKMAIPKDVVTIDKGSYLIVDDSKRRWRLPLGNASFTPLIRENELRICREVATERDLFSLGGTFYELPAENADGFAKIRPVSTHNYRINDYSSYRGLMVLTGIDKKMVKDNEHIIMSDDQQCAVWAGAIDDLWKLGKPRGKGGPWIEEQVIAKKPSDAYLFGLYDKRTLTLTNHTDADVEITIEFDPLGDNDWMSYKTVAVKANKKLIYKIEKEVQARWIRFVSDKNAKLSTWLEYN